MWSFRSEMYVTDQDAEFRADLLGKGTFPIEVEGTTCISWPNCHDESSSLSLLGISGKSTFSLENHENFVSWGSFCGVHEGKSSSALLATTSSNKSSYNKSSETGLMKEATTCQQNYARIESQSMILDELSSLVHHDGLPSCLNSTKRSRSNEDHHQVLGRNVKPKTVIRRLDFSSSCKDGLGGESRSSPSNTEEDSNGETICSTLNPKHNGKTRSSRGTATDPQSLYARKRRERINERLKILQSIIPNGTKVDISTMLDEAVHYVKFLQLQIRLLSSDEMWMYAPIAYNGTDTNVDSWT